MRSCGKILIFKITVKLKTNRNHFPNGQGHLRAVAAKAGDLQEMFLHQMFANDGGVVEQVDVLVGVPGVDYLIK